MQAVLTHLLLAAAAAAAASFSKSRTLGLVRVEDSATVLGLLVADGLRWETSLVRSRRSMGGSSSDQRGLLGEAERSGDPRESDSLSTSLSQHVALSSLSLGSH